MQGDKSGSKSFIYSFEEWVLLKMAFNLAFDKKK